ncbi:MAG TPA: class I SAM-dependent methyltransferase [Bryobacteraceae bacterium]|jgi:SAM-dependent methyltransferase
MLKPMNPAEFHNIARSERDFWWYRGMREILFRLLDPVAATAASVLEAGCGTGHLSKSLEQRYGWRMTPLDLGWEGLEYAQGYGLSRLVQGNVTALPFAGAVFDALVSMDVLVHLPPGGEAGALSEFARVLKPGGLLAIRVSAFHALRSRHSEFVGERQRFTRGALRQALKLAGFEVERATYVNSLLTPVSLFKFRVWEPLMRAPLGSGVVDVPAWLDRLLYLPLRAEAKWIEHGGSFPAGQSLLVLGRKRRGV